ncbi:hypothetical protein ACFWAR_19385 [Streptomyces sp. NPDC059917]|uniref:glycine-rich domain-containing protein n=1 Tax=Streptomyces sp. NPDC059917 TaxID=3347002 RepID=UPI003653AD11
MTKFQWRAAGAVMAAALLTGGLTSGPAQADSNTKIYDKPGSYSVSLPNGKSEMTIVLVGGGGGGGGAGLYSEMYGTGGGGGGGGAAGLVKCTLSGIKEGSAITLHVGGAGGGGRRVAGAAATTAQGGLP